MARETLSHRKPVSARDVRAGYSPEKRASDIREHLWAFVVIRRIAFPISAMCINIGLTPTQVTLVGTCILIAGLLLLGGSSGDILLASLGGIFLVAWHVSDCVDGDIARYQGSHSYLGEFLDWFSGHLMHLGAPLAVGFAVGASAGLNGTPAWLERHALPVGIAVGLLEASRTAVTTKAKLVFMRESVTRRPMDTAVRLRSRLRWAALSGYAFGSFKIPVLLACALMGKLGVWLLAFGAFSFALWIAVTLEGTLAGRRADTDSKRASSS